jgi:hypothetical protein
MKTSFFFLQLARWICGYVDMWICFERLADYSVQYLEKNISTYFILIILITLYFIKVKRTKCYIGRVNSCYVGSNYGHYGHYGHSLCSSRETETGTRVLHWLYGFCKVGRN